VFILFGPTASGKTEFLEKLFTGAHPLCRGEAVSADSMQVYRGMDIGTAKPPASLCRDLPHHLIDLRDPGEQFNAGDFVRLAGEACAEIWNRSALPVVSGGTGFYLKNFIYGLPGTPPSNPALRAALKAELLRQGTGPLVKELERRDPRAAERIHPNDAHRLLRALEVCRLGLPLSSFVQGKMPRRGFRFFAAGIRRPREELYRRIGRRCDDMFRLGLAAEVEGLFKRGYTPRDPGLRAIGYREFFVPEASGRWSFTGDSAGVRTLVARNSRRYAKRQETFFSTLVKGSLPPGKGFDAVWLDGDEKALDLLKSLVHTFLTKSVS
jgi:tRNA dimethylallyltransferase